VICPKCGQPGFLVRAASDRRNFYRVYHKREGKSYKVCYLGPVGHIRRNKLILPLSVVGISDQELIKDSVEAIFTDLSIDAEDSDKSLTEEIRHLQWMLRTIANGLGEYLEEGRG
jgi:hypothetical protein